MYDSITLLGQAQFNLSLRCRYMIRPSLKKKICKSLQYQYPNIHFPLWWRCSQRNQKVWDRFVHNKRPIFQWIWEVVQGAELAHTEDPTIKAMVAVDIIGINHMVVSVDLQGNLGNTDTHFQKSPEGTQLSQVGREENHRRKYFIINLHKSMGPCCDRTCNSWICTQTGIYSQTRYWLRYVARYTGS